MSAYNEAFIKRDIISNAYSAIAGETPSAFIRQKPDEASFGQNVGHFIVSDVKKLISRFSILVNLLQDRLYVFRQATPC